MKMGYTKRNTYWGGGYKKELSYDKTVNYLK